MENRNRRGGVESSEPEHRSHLATGFLSVARALCTLRRGSAWRRFFFGDGPQQVESHTTGLKSTRRESPMCFRKTAGLLPRGMREHLQSIEPVCKRTAAYRRFAVLPGRTKETSGLNSIFVSHETSRLYTESYAESRRCRRRTRRPPAQSCTRSTPAGVARVGGAKRHRLQRHPIQASHRDVQCREASCMEAAFSLSFPAGTDAGSRIPPAFTPCAQSSPCRCAEASSNATKPLPVLQIQRSECGRNDLSPQ